MIFMKRFQANFCSYYYLYDVHFEILSDFTTTYILGSIQHLSNDSLLGYFQHCHVCLCCLTTYYRSVCDDRQRTCLYSIRLVLRFSLLFLDEVIRQIVSGPHLIHGLVHMGITDEFPIKPH